jgi:hypothetical protein
LVSEKQNAAVPVEQSSDDISINEMFHQHDQALIAHEAVIPAAVAMQSLPPELQRAIQVLSDTYEALDLRIETTFGNAGNDFIGALPEIEGYEVELQQFVDVLIDDIRHTANRANTQSVLLHLSFQDKNDLTEQMLSLVSPQEGS